eukprot:3934253-Rhodomonas_salina.1
MLPFMVTAPPFSGAPLPRGAFPCREPLHQRELPDPPTPRFVPGFVPALRVPVQEPLLYELCGNGGHLVL